MSILRMYFTPADAKRPSHYREAWWEEDTQEFVLHHGKVGESGTTTVERVRDEQEADILLDSLAQQNATDGYVDVAQIPQETFRVLIRLKGTEPTQVENTNAQKFAEAYTALLAWRGLGDVTDWHLDTDQSVFSFQIETVHRSKTIKLASDAVKTTDFRSDRMSLERN